MSSEFVDHGIEYNEIVINLKVIASITTNTKLYAMGNLLNIEHPSVVPESVRRWFRQESRDDAIKKIDRVITKAFTFDTPSIRRYITEAKAGVSNMQVTYCRCIQTSARLDTILDKIDFFLQVVPINRLDHRLCLS